MADDDGSRRPSQPPTPVNPAGVGSSTSNRASPGMVSPGTIREILQTGDQSLIDDAVDQWSAADMGRLLESIPIPITVSPVGVGSAASNLSQSPGFPRTPTGGVADAGGGSSPSSSAGARKDPGKIASFFSSDQNLVVIGQLQKRCIRDSGSFLQKVQSLSVLIPILVKKVFVAALL